ncbi:uncharacterized protein LOC110015202 [Oryzias latipes]|uniref:uncharacterized protein LOC110015202 n=1 Tax=Oryzias latipes TaxID=8090 RepID=UPI000CE17CCA|nr:uncharacterized protein LOC110015202 [Oryzias latipes]
MTERTGQTPDPADPEGLQHALSIQENLLTHQAEAITLLSSAQWDLFRRFDSITQFLSASTSQHANSAAAAQDPDSVNKATSVSADIPENARLQPEPSYGNVDAFGGFLLQCQLIFQQAPRYYHSDHSKISLIVNSLRSKALQWAQAFLASHPIAHLPYDSFIGEFRLVFDQPRKQEEAVRRLLSLKQGNRPPEADSFEDLVTAALRSDDRLRERSVTQNYPPRNVINDGTRAYVSIVAKPVICRNVKPDALSRKYSSSDSSSDSSILPMSCFVGSLTWEIESKVQQAQGQKSLPGDTRPASPATGEFTGPSAS